jgi:hypothetical protein
MRGYNDLVALGVLFEGGKDFNSIHAFFEAPEGLLMAGLTPDHRRCGNDPTKQLCAASSEAMIIYAKLTSAPLLVPVVPMYAGDWTVQCYNLATSVFSSEALFDVTVAADEDDTSPTLPDTQTIACPDDHEYDYADRVFVLRRL